jgi:hypothetical protein
MYAHFEIARKSDSSFFAFEKENTCKNLELKVGHFGGAALRKSDFLFDQ